MARFNLSRRNYVKASLGFIGSVSIATLIGLENLATPEAALAKEPLPENTKNPQQSLQELMDGNQRFVSKKRENPHQTLARIQEVAKGQRPFAAVLSCADSRVPVEIVFDQGFGDIFVVRNAGNLATSQDIGSLEFGTLVLGAEILMVIGHESCGAVQATLAGNEVPGKIGSIIEEINPAVGQYKGQQKDPVALKRAVEANVLFQAERLKASPVISKLIDEKKLLVVGAYYSLDDGTISIVS